MNSERKRDTDAAVQSVIDDVTARAGGLRAWQIATELASGLGAIGVSLSSDDLGMWSNAIVNGERIRAAEHYR
jgi:hypothetical protein